MGKHIDEYEILAEDKKSENGKKRERKQNKINNTGGENKTNINS